jgi:hypothetical protein
MNGHPASLQLLRLDLAGGEHSHVGRVIKSLCHTIGRIVVPGNRKNGDAVFTEPSHLPAQKYSGAEIFPITVVQVACQQNEGDLFFDGQIDEILEGLAAGIAKEFSGCGLVFGQTPQWAVEVHIGCVNEFKHRHFPWTIS